MILPYNIGQDYYPNYIGKKIDKEREEEGMLYQIEYYLIDLKEATEETPHFLQYIQRAA
jgi:CRISPR/Cas system CMR-associated protein Cmr5 small subunit